ncbi:MAG: monooxygenase, partial [Novosphingobium sp.]
DLIPAISTGFVAQGTPAAGQRFIQPILADGRKLDDLVGQGWRLFVADGGDGDVIVASELPDSGAVTQWLKAREVEAVLVRPDHYVFGTGSAAELLALRDAMLRHKLEIAA